MIFLLTTEVRRHREKILKIFDCETLCLSVSVVETLITTEARRHREKILKDKMRINLNKTVKLNLGINRFFHKEVLCASVSLWLKR